MESSEILRDARGIPARILYLQQVPGDAESVALLRCPILIVKSIRQQVLDFLLGLQRQFNPLSSISIQSKATNSSFQNA